MTKSELIDELALQTPDISRQDVEIVVNTVIETMAGALANHHRIEIRGFGAFVAIRQPPFCRFPSLFLNPVY